MFVKDNHNVSLKKHQPKSMVFFDGGGGWDRTIDQQVMSPLL